MQAQERVSKAKGKGKTFQQLMDDGAELPEIPKIGQVWIESFTMGNEIVKTRYYFAGVGLGKEAVDLIKATRDHGTTFTYEKVNGQDAVFLWADVGERERIPIDHENFTITVPLAIAAKIRANAKENNRSVEAHLSEELKEIYTVNMPSEAAK